MDRQSPAYFNVGGMRKVPCSFDQFGFFQGIYTPLLVQKVREGMFGTHQQRFVWKNIQWLGLWLAFTKKNRMVGDWKLV